MLKSHLIEKRFRPLNFFIILSSLLGQSILANGLLKTSSLPISSVASDIATILHICILAKAVSRRQFRRSPTAASNAAGSN
jgi:hypothetical protein